MGRLTEHVRLWLDLLGSTTRLLSVFVGGGTPSIYVDEYAELFQLIQPFLLPGAETTIETNPDDIEASRLQRWRNIGFRRISLGVQTFSAAGLRFMHRSHDARAAMAAIDLARTYFDDVNVDLIYGWPQQNIEDFLADIDRAVSLGATHLSLYTLTYEPRTPIGRAMARGRIDPVADDTLAEFYDLARERLAMHGFMHEEVSNWAKPGHACRHNALYWQDQPFLGVGVGAHGYIDGLRYQYRADDRRFLRTLLKPQVAKIAADDLEKIFDVVVDRQRHEDTWLIEYVGSGLRSRYGLERTRMEAEGRHFQPTANVSEAIRRGLLMCGESGRITLDPREWFRETAWCLELLKSFPKIQ